MLVRLNIIFVCKRYCNMLISENEREKRYVGHNWPLCGSVRYNPDVLLCCDKVIRPKYHVRKCCGNQGYNPSTSVCCSATIVPRLGKDAKCCGVKSYNPQRSLCCSGKVVNYQGGYVSSALMKCCGSTPYNSQSHICCSGAVTKMGGAHSSCCGQIGYNR